MIDLKDNPPFLNEFLEYLTGILNKSPNTVKEYNYDKLIFELVDNPVDEFSSWQNLLDKNIHNNFLIKPNIKELEEMFEADLDTIDKAVEKCKYFLDKNIKHIIVSMGGKGALYINKDGAYTAQVPKGTLINSVGAGDSMVVGFIAGFELGKKPEEAFKLAVAAGSATAYSYGLGEKDLINKLYNEINIKKEGE